MRPRGGAMHRRPKLLALQGLSGRNHRVLLEDYGVLVQAEEVVGVEQNSGPKEAE